MKSIKNIQRIVILLLIGLSFVIGCGEDEELTKEEKNTNGVLTCIVKNASTEKGVEGALVVVEEEGASATTDATGRAALELPLGKHDIKVTAKGYIEAGQTVTIRPEGIKVNIILTPGVRVKGVVTSDVGNPIAGVRVTLGNYSRFTDNLGLFTLSPILPGTYRFIAEKPGYEKATRDGVSIGTDEANIDISLTRHVSGRIIFEKGLRGKTSFGISVVNADGTGIVKELTNAADKFPSWSPDSSQIVFQGKGQGREGGAWKIYTMNANGIGIRNISPNTDNDTTPAWSPDGTMIAFVHWEILGEPAIYVMDVNGGIRRRITDCDEEGAPTWSPDSSKIAFVKKSKSGEEIEFEEEVVKANLDIYVVNIDGENEAQLTKGKKNEILPAWSPDGSKLSYTTLAGSGIADVYVVDLYSGQSERVSSGPGFNGYSCWSPDGTKIAFSSNRNGSFGIYMVDADGGNETVVYDNPGEDELLSQGCWAK
ncbi:PD40 domain-containing protein [bacterium]|nr:PD40 domain-containing protein [bacterium]